MLPVCRSFGEAVRRLKSALYHERMTLSFTSDVPDSPVGRIDPRWKLLALGFAVVGVACLRQPVTLVVALMMSLALLAITRLPIKAVVSRFAAFFLFVMPFVVFLIMAEWPTGWKTAALVAGRATALFALALVLADSGPVHRALQAAQSLGVPRAFTQIAVMSYRYVFLMRDEFLRMRTAMRVRGFRAGSNRHTYRTFGYLAGSMLLRGEERAHRVAQAMRCRGFDGQFRSLYDFRTRWVDVVFAAIAVSLTIGLLAGEWIMRS